MLVAMNTGLAEPANDMVNVAAHLPRMSALQPDTPALVWRSGRDGAGKATYANLSFAELHQLSDRYAHGFESIGIMRGMRTILMVRPSPEFFALTFALYKIGATPVLIDPGMGKLRMVDCLRAIEAEAFIGIPLAHAMRVAFRSAFRTVRINVTVGRRLGWGGQTLASLKDVCGDPYEMAPTRADEAAAIIFTTGSTGPPKGVLYEHGMFDAQVRILRDHFKIEPGEIDLPTFPLFALFDPALGMTAVIPEMDPTRPAHVDPTKIIEAIHDNHVTHMFGSPALLNRVGRYGEANNVRLPSLRRVISAGAPVPPATMRRYTKMLAPGVQIFTPYGATEALPVASIGSDEVLGETAEESAKGRGTCVGKPVPEATVRVIEITEEPIAEWDDSLSLPAGAIGEIVVRGPTVTKLYLTSEAATQKAKMIDPRDGAVWHRMGDVGYLDASGRMWFCGRKAHRVVTTEGTLFTIPCEAIFNQHPKVFRTALVGVGEKGKQTPVLCVELDSEGCDCAGKRNREQIVRELQALGQGHAHTKAIAHFLIHPGFPVDIRHNAKIFREKLADWAAKNLWR